MVRIAVFASGSGSNFQAIMDAIQNGELLCEVGLLVCDRPGAKVIEKAKTLGVETYIFTPKNFLSKEEFETEILAALEEAKVDLIVLAGYMRLIGQVLLKAYEGRILNLHPSILPSFPGKDAIGQAWSACVKLTGITVHFVDEGMDTGPIIAQKGYEIKESDTIDSLTEEIHRIEHQWYPKVIQKVILDKWGRVHA